MLAIREGGVYKKSYIAYSGIIPSYVKHESISCIFTYIVHRIPFCFFLARIGLPNRTKVNITEPNRILGKLNRGRRENGRTRTETNSRFECSVHLDVQFASIQTEPNRYLQCSCLVHVWFI